MLLDYNTAGCKNYLFTLFREVRGEKKNESTYTPKKLNQNHLISPKQHAQVINI